MLSHQKQISKLVHYFENDRKFLSFIRWANNDCSKYKITIQELMNNYSDLKFSYRQFESFLDGLNNRKYNCNCLACASNFALNKAGYELALNSKK